MIITHLFNVSLKKKNQNTQARTKALRRSQTPDPEMGIINAYCFKLLQFEAISYITVDNYSSRHLLRSRRIIAHKGRSIVK